MLLLKIFTVLLISALAESATDRVLCYYQSWVAYDGPGQVTPEDLDASLCTHMFYAFIAFGDDGKLQAEDEELDINEKLFYRFTALKKKNPNLKVLLSVGGANADPYTFADIANDATKRNNFVTSARSFIKTYNFDGLDVDWEYPEDPDAFILLLKALHDNFQPDGLLVTAAVKASPDDGYDVKRMNSVLDQINIMAYDFYGSWSSYIGQVSPLYASSVESDWEKENLNIAVAIKHWKAAGATPSKLNVGLAFYGDAFGLQNQANHGLHAAFSGPADPMPLLQDGWSYSYAEICQYTTNWTHVYDDEQKSHYKYHGRNWVGYDDPTSLRLKVEYSKNQNVGGIMMWSVDQDDAHGKCGRKFDMLETVNEALGK